MPFPQADDFEKILAMFEVISGAEEGNFSKEALLLEFDTTPRQIDYYANSLRWLNLITISKGKITLTEWGKDLSCFSYSEKIKFLAKIIFSNPVFYYVFHGGICSSHSDIEACEMTRRFKMCGVEALSTQERRLQTVFAWIKYFKTQTQSE